MVDSASNRNEYQVYLLGLKAAGQDMRILGVKYWKKVALNRDEWTQLFKKVRAHQGLSS